MRETSDDEQVDTSDAEELETLQAGGQDYWSTLLPGIRTGHSFLDRLDGRNASHVHLTPGRSSTVAFRTPHHIYDGDNRPRKRLKVDVTPSSSTVLEGEVDIDPFIPFSSQSTLCHDSTVPFSSVRSSKGSIPPPSSITRANSQDPLDLLPRNTPDQSKPFPVTHEISIETGGTLANDPSSVTLLFSQDPTPLRRRARSHPDSLTESLSESRIPHIPPGIGVVLSSPPSSVASSPARKQSTPPQVGRTANPQPPVQETDVNTGRWSFRSRNVHQMHPYLYERLQYKRQMRGIPDAVVNVRSPERRRRSPPRTEQDLDFLVNDQDAPDNHDLLHEVSGNGNSKHRRKHYNSRQDHPIADRASVAGSSRNFKDVNHNDPTSRRTSRMPSATPPDDNIDTGQSPSPHEKWYPNFLQDLSSSNPSDDDGSTGLPIHIYYKSPKEGAPSRTSLSKELDKEQTGLPEPSAVFSPPRRRRRRRFPKPPPWERHTKAQKNPTDEEPSSIPGIDLYHAKESENQIVPVSSGEQSETGAPMGPRYSRSLSSDNGSISSESDKGLSLRDRQRLRALRRMMPAGMIQKQLQAAPKPSRRSTTAPPADSSSPPQLHPGQSKIRVNTDTDIRNKFLIAGDSESSDLGEPIIEISSSSERSISDVEELRTHKYPGVLDIPLFSASEDEETDAGLEIVDDADIGAWLQRQPTRSRTSGQDSVEAREGDLIDRMLSRTRVSRTKRRNTIDAGASSRRGQQRVGGRPKKQNGIHISVGGTHLRKKARQLRLPELFAKSGLQNEGNHKAGANRDEHAPNQNKAKLNLEVSKAAPKSKHKQVQPRPVYVFPTGGHVASGRRHTEGITIDVEDASTSQLDLSHPFLRPDLQPPANLPRSILESSDYCATHPTEFCLLPCGVSFSDDTYIGNGRLKELVAVLRDRSIAAPEQYSTKGIDLTLSMDIDEFSKVLQSVFDRLLQDITNASGYISEKYCKWQDTLHAVCQFLTWMSAGTYELVVPLRNLAKNQAQRLVQHLEDLLESSISDMDTSFILSLYWFALELSMRSCRSPQDGVTILFEFATSLVKHLLQRGFLKPAHSIFPQRGVIADLTPPQRVSQIWISIFHVTDSLHDWFSNDFSGPTTQSHGIWQLVQKAFGEEQLSDLDASEQLWSVIFNICALSQFSVLGVTTMAPRLSASWDIVSLALRRIRLSAEPTIDIKLPRRRLVKRDRYIRLIISRCFFLRKRWLWSLKDASLLFSHLVEVFKSRKFANLNGESSDFPSFMRHNDFSLLSEYRNSDTAFVLFLKLAAQSVEDMRHGNRDAVDPGLPLRLRKLLSMLIPVGSVPFNKSAPPSAQELSMFYNRLSAIAVAIYLDPSSSNVHNRLHQARRYIAFKDSDLSTRRACIRGMMHFAMIMQRLHVPLAPILEWMTEITNILIDEYQAIGGDAVSNKDPRNRVIIALQMLLGSLRRIIEGAQKLEGKSYPDPAFLDGPWISRVFSTATDVSNLSTTTGFEIQRLVQTFLDNRAAVMPKPRRPQIHTAVEDSQESQDYYGQMDIDLNDPELLAALGEEPESPEIREMQVKDKLVAEIIDKHVSPGIYRLVFKHVSDVPAESVQEESCINIDTWIDCWVRCAQVVVHNGKRDWSFYLTLGSQSWERIIQGSWRRRVGLRFMYMFLRLDPSSYPSYKDRFIDVLLESLVTSTITMEHEYVALLFSVDCLQHQLLRDITCERQADGDFVISRTTFGQSRVTILATIFRNLSESLQNEASQPDLRNTNQTSLEHLVKMFSTMQDIYRSMEPPGSDRHKEYGAFCSRVMKELKDYGAVFNHDRLRRLVDVMKWGDGVLS